MKSKLDLKSFGIQELSAKEKMEINGGKVWFFSWWVVRPRAEEPGGYSVPILV